MPTFAIQQTFRPPGPKGATFFETTGLGTPLNLSQLQNLIAQTSASTFSITLSETVAQGALVNVWDNGGVANGRNADGSTVGKWAWGFALTGGNNGDQISVGGPGQVNPFASGLTPGAVEYLSATTPGGTQETVSTGAGTTNQTVGAALSATSYIFVQGVPIEMQAAA